MVTAAIVAATAASVASAAASAAAGGPEGISAGTPGPAEERARRRARDSYLAAANSVGAGAALSGKLDPYLFGLAGMDATYTDNYDEWMSAQQEVDDNWNFINATRGEIQELNKQKRQAKGKKAKKAIQRQIKARKRETKRARQNMNNLEQRAHRLATNPVTITGLDESEAVAQSRQATQDIIAQMQERALGALSGDVKDPRLLRELEEAELELREGLRRRFGSDYANTTPGRRALADFEQRRSEAMSEAAMRDVRELVPLAQQTELNAFNLASGRTDLLRNIPREKLTWADAYQSLGQSWQNFGSQYQKDREMALGAAQANQAAGAGEYGPSTLSRISDVLGKVGQAGTTLAFTGAGGGVTPQKAATASVGTNAERTPLGVRSIARSVGGGIKTGLGATRDFLLKY